LGPTAGEVMNSTKKLDRKIQQEFGEFAIDKGLLRRMGLSGDDRHVPSYVLDWIVTHLARGGATTSALERQVHEFIEEHLPAKGDKDSVKFRLGQGKVLTLLDAVSVTVNLKRDVEYRATLPCLDAKDVRIDESLIKANESLLQGSTWGAVRIRHDSDDTGIRIIEFRPMQTGRISLDAFLECRQAFSVEEWIDVLLRTMGYEPDRYAEREKLWMLCRLIPVVHNRVNMMELAPPGSGKSYIFNNISRHVWLTAADISPAVLFYNRQNKTPGLLTRYDLLVLDEAQSIRFSNASEIQAQLKGYLEQGVFARGDCSATAECGLMLLANVDLEQDSSRRYSNGKPVFVPARSDFIRRLPDAFLESPLVDRFHGILPGWEIPPFSTDQQANGFGLKSDFFAEVCHALRSASDISQRVRASLRLSGGKRDCTAVERLACGLAKLLLINPDHERFEELIVRPAHELRRIVRTQLNELDPETYLPDLSIVRPGESPKFGRLSHYDLLEMIGEGGMAKVFKALDRDSQSIVALKKVSTEGVKVNEAAIQREISIYMQLQRIACQHVLSVRDIFREGDTYALVTEFADGGSLWDLMVGEGSVDDAVALEVGTVKDIALQIADGLTTLHENEKRIVHRDVKPQNILRCDDTWKIADFGISKFIDKPVTGYTFQGAHSQPWAPPEQIQGAQAHPSADMYAFGKVVCFLLTGTTDAPEGDVIEREWLDIVEPCLAIQPEHRPTIAVVTEQLSQMKV